MVNDESALWENTIWLESQLSFEAHSSITIFRSQLNVIKESLIFIGINYLLFHLYVYVTYM